VFVAGMIGSCSGRHHHAAVVRPMQAGSTLGALHSEQCGTCSAGRGGCSRGCCCRGLADAQALAAAEALDSLACSCVPPGRWVWHWVLHQLQHVSSALPAALA
jgi:hypothetical protein